MRLDHQLMDEIAGTDGGGPIYTRVLRKMGKDGWLGVGWPETYSAR